MHSSNRQYFIKYTALPHGKRHLSGNQVNSNRRRPPIDGRQFIPGQKGCIAASWRNNRVYCSLCRAYSKFSQDAAPKEIRDSAQSRLLVVDFAAIQDEDLVARGGLTSHEIAVPTHCRRANRKDAANARGRNNRGLTLRGIFHDRDPEVLSGEKVSQSRLRRGRRVFAGGRRLQQQLEAERRY